MKINRRTVIYITAFILVISCLTKLYYIHYTDTWERQHDVIAFGALEGHAYYIQYLHDNKHLPDFDPREIWGFFQPPLHHIISAFVLGVSELCGASEKTAQENIQIITCIYMMLLSVLSVIIYFKASGNTVNKGQMYLSDVLTSGAVITALVVSFHPIFILLSGSINNDALALFLSLLSICMASAWYEKPTLINTVLLALIIGLSMLAKLTGGLTAAAVAALFFVKCFGFSDDKKLNFKERLSFFYKNYLAKMCVFAAFVFPTGLFWTIRNKIKWDMPFNYIPPVGEVFPDGITLTSRIFDIRTKSVFPYLLKNGNEYDEFNVPLLLIKSSLFGEYNYAEYGRLINLSSKILFFTALALIIISLYAGIKVLFFNNEVLLKWKILLGVTYMTYLLAYLYFAFTSGNFSAGDFRYSAICIIIEGIFLGLYTDKIKSRKLKTGIAILCVLFAGSAFVTYVMLGLRS